MADIEETAAQRQIRLRREKREAKIRAGGTERLDKITMLSGRTPESMRYDDPPISVPTTPAARTPTRTGNPPTLANASNPAQVQAQEEYLRSLLRAPQPQEGQDEEIEDPMMKMMTQLMGNFGGEGEPGALPFSPDDISKATGLPSFLTDMVMGKKKTPPTPAQEKAARNWKILHLLFAVVAGIYLLFVLQRSITLFGSNPPAPATIRNPFLLFVMGELLIEGSKIAMAGQTVKKGPGFWLQILRDLGRDGSIVVFIMGFASWWSGTV